MTRTSRAAGQSSDQEEEIEEAQQQSGDSVDRYIEEGLMVPTEAEEEEEKPVRQAREPKGKGKKVASGPKRNKKIEPTKPQLLAHL